MVCACQDSEDLGGCECTLPGSGLCVSICVVCVKHEGVRGVWHVRVCF